MTIMSGKADCPPEMRKRKKKSNHSLAYQIQTTLRSEMKRSSSVTGVILYKLKSFSQVRIKNTCSPSAILVLFKNLRSLGKNWSIWHGLPFKDSDVLLCNWPLSRVYTEETLLRTGPIGQLTSNDDSTHFSTGMSRKDFRDFSSRLDCRVLREKGDK